MPRVTLQQIASRNPVLALYEQGCTPSQVKELFTSTLKPYFRDEQVLRSIDIGALGVVAINAGRLSLDPTHQTLLQLAVQHGWTAISADKEASLMACVYWEERIVKAMSEFWSIAHLELEKTGLPLEEFRVEIFRNIGSLVEACLKPALGHMLCQIRVGEGNSSPSEEVARLDLGQIVNELHRKYGDTELTAPSPWGIRLNQWRNIAQHHSTFVRGGKLVGSYGQPGRMREIELDRHESLDVATKLQDILVVLNTFRVLYIHENGTELAERMQDVPFRAESLNLSFAAAVATQGFIVEEIEDSTSKIGAKISDGTEGPWKERFVHCSQFLFYLWTLFPRDRVELRYFSKDGTPRGMAWAKGDDFAEAAKLADPMELTAKRTVFELLKSGE